MWLFPKIRGEILHLPATRIIVFRALYCTSDTPVYGNYQVPAEKVNFVTAGKAQ